MELAVATPFVPADLARPVSPMQLLAGGGLTAAVSAAGTGVAWIDGADLTRWRADRVEDADGLAVWLRDLDSGRVWTAGWRPGDEAYEARFGAGTVEVVRRDGAVETRLCWAVAPEGALVGRLALRSLDGRARRVEVTTFAEVVLHHRDADAGHPAFSKLFVQTEAVGDRPILVARRRKRSPEDPHVWLSHWLDGAAEGVSWETDRLAFVGRGRSRRDPAALDAPGPLGGTTGAVLDPVVALRTVVEVPADGAATRAFGLTGADSRGAVLDRADALADLDAVEAAVEAATAAEQRRRDAASLDDESVQAAQALIGPLLFGDPDLWAPATMRTAPADGATLDVEGSGPLVVARVRTEAGAEAVRQLARWRDYWDDLGLDVRLAAVTDAASVSAGVPVIDAGDPDALTLAASRATLWADDALPVPSSGPAPLAPTHAPRPTGDLALDDDTLRAFNGIGGFSPDGTEYVMHLRPGSDGRPALPPLPWTNVIANEHGGFVVSERGAASTWAANSRENRLTPWGNDPVEDPGEALYVQDLDAGTLWSPTPGPAPAAAPYEVRHGFGYSTWRTVVDGVEQHTTTSLAPDAAARLTVIRLTNPGDRPRRLAVTASARLTLGSREDARHVVTERAGDVLTARNPHRGEFSDRVAVARAVAQGADVSLTADRAAFLGRFGTDAAPLALAEGGPLDGAVGAGRDAAVHRVALTLAPGESQEVAFVLGEAASREEADALATRFSEIGAVHAAIGRTKDFWRETTTALQIETPEPAFDWMVNGWLVYQNLSCRLWGRTAFYQSGGAYGFRDQLQDTSALVYARPDLTREQIVRNAAHQFEAGDVLHWWHPPLAKGIRTRFADDLLWLPLLASEYVATTGDGGVLDQEVRFLTAPPLEDGQDEVFLQPDEAGTSASVYEHAARAIDRSLAVGAHGLPLMGTGDWNDGMNRVGREGRGESVWMGFFLAATLDAFLPHVETRGDTARAERYRQHRADLAAALDADGWDGGWYRRAFYDDGAVMGSADSDECQIDALVQAWAVLSGVAPAGRAAQALDAMERRLVDDEAGIIRLLDPPFDVTPHDPGYIQGYVPGVRENGGQYTHAALWAVRALAQAGRCERAARLLAALSPVSHADTPEAVAVYKTEPYVIAADVYGVAPHVGRGGWTWYTGSAGWMWRVAVESVLGFGIDRGEAITLAPCVPADWPAFSLRYRLPDGSGTTYAVHVTRGDAPGLTLDGEPVEAGDGWRVPLVRDGAEHDVRLTL
ncbi:GH36-type glycosyl hydrolase domain-containing protein [Rubrivirga sp.]|uniref:GH36-type glycosyl hydrolase domain-containing protein n=1 Tax=Rubrivirga sp. TaxID=1885344 RepID=UPI003B52B3FF